VLAYCLTLLSEEPEFLVRPCFLGTGIACHFLTSKIFQTALRGEWKWNDYFLKLLSMRSVSGMDTCRIWEEVDGLRKYVTGHKKKGRIKRKWKDSVKGAMESSELQEEDWHN
jgi:hypothetical protein